MKTVYNIIWLRSTFVSISLLACLELDILALQFDCIRNQKGTKGNVLVILIMLGSMYGTLYITNAAFLPATPDFSKCSETLDGRISLALYYPLFLIRRKSMLCLFGLGFTLWKFPKEFWGYKWKIFVGVHPVSPTILLLWWGGGWKKAQPGKGYSWLNFRVKSFRWGVTAIEVLLTLQQYV